MTHALHRLLQGPGLPARHWRPEEVVRLVVGVLLAVAASGIAAELALRATGLGSGPDATFWRLMLGLLGLQAPGMAMVHLFLRSHGHGWASGLGLRPGLVPAAWGAALAVAAVMVTYPLEHGIMELLKAIGRSPEPQASVQFLRKAAPWQQAILGFLAVGPAAVVEEALFRGVLYSAGRDAGHRGWAWLGSSLLFGLAHGHGPTLVPLTLLGLGLAWAYERTGSLFACCVAHAGFNMVGLLVAVLGLGLDERG